MQLANLYPSWEDVFTLMSPVFTSLCVHVALKYTLNLDLAEI